MNNYLPGIFGGVSLDRWAASLAGIFFLAVLPQGLSAQQAGHYSLYRFTKFNFNPAYAGLDGSLSMTGIYRAQWTGLEGAPTSQYIDAHLPLYFINSGIGIQFENDVLGAEHNIRLNLAYSYQLNVGAGILSLGIAGGIFQKRLDGSRLITPDGNYGENQTPDHNDDILPFQQENALLPAFQAGVYFQGSWLEAGLGVRNLTEPLAEYSTVSVALNREFFFQAESRINVGVEWALIPMLFVRTDLGQLQTDLGATVMYNENFFLGTTFRGYNSNSIDAVGIMGGLNLSPSFKLAYNYDITLSGLNNVSNGSHEIMLRYELNKPIGEGRPPKIIYNPRSL